MAVKEPTDPELQTSLFIAYGLLVIAFISPMLALMLPMPPFKGLELGGWFSRSGAVTTVFALLAESVLIRAKLSITPVGWGWGGLQEQRDRFIPKFNAPELTVFCLTIVGTLIWAYGDLPFTWLSQD
ncbi:hypothetical protein DK254_00045 [Pseudomonas sp. RW407]|uniref:hypothetical protein n=1 Tax=Pseudomonas sp. RW407 TaxID=2202894 RepID=UPI000D6F49AA|nr:hypothetical protein [Pseudomonas sp. RW407]PWU30681.1 hypothetical protein DK254_11465 [Pseudomonas sp. RW407]PWU32114.1 hypothetical protein DK254_00045 [Pseudomonas sp. RW407]